MKQLLMILMSSALLLSACGHDDDNHKQSQKKSEQQETKHHKKVVQGRTYIDDILIVNKDIPLPKDYNPGVNPKAQQALTKLKEAAQKQGLNIVTLSDFRSYDTQVQLYQSYVNRDGKAAADKYSARPGYSEHQTGLAFDVGKPGSDKNLKIDFADTKEGQWLKENAYKYGFIIRFDKDKTKSTGYQYEPWHLRYLGKTKAKKVYDSGKSLEEYLGLYPKNK